MTTDSSDTPGSDTPGSDTPGSDTELVPELTFIKIAWMWVCLFAMFGAMVGATTTAEHGLASGPARGVAAGAVVGLITLLPVAVMEIRDHRNRDLSQRLPRQITDV